jgi:hypothetical protein
MEVHDAVAQINDVWAHVARTERFRGYRPATVAGTAGFGLLAAILQPWLVPVPTADADGFMTVWVSVAIASVLLVGVELCASYLRCDSQLERQLLRRAVQQFVPCLCGGGVVTWVFAVLSPEHVSLLPGLWAICFSLGVFASLPFVTPSVSWVAVYYLLAGAVCLAVGRDELALHPWLMGGTFGVGQLMMAAALLWAEERRHET